MKKKNRPNIRILCRFAASYFQIVFRGSRMVWKCGAKMVIIEIPIISFSCALPS